CFGPKPAPWERLGSPSSRRSWGVEDELAHTPPGRRHHVHQPGGSDGPPASPCGKDGRGGRSVAGSPLRRPSRIYGDERRDRPNGPGSVGGGGLCSPDLPPPFDARLVGRWSGSLSLDRLAHLTRWTSAPTTPIFSLNFLRSRQVCSTPTD